MTSDVIETESGLLVVSEGVVAIPDEPTPESIVDELSDREILVSMFYLMNNMSERLDNYEALLKEFLKPENLQKKIHEVVKEFTANGGIASLLPGMMGGF